MKKVILFFISVFLWGCPGPESGTISLGQVSVGAPEGFLAGNSFNFTARFTVTVPAKLSVKITDENEKTVADLGTQEVKIEETSKTFTAKIEQVGALNAVFTLTADGVEAQTKTASFQVTEEGAEIPNKVPDSVTVDGQTFSLAFVENFTSVEGVKSRWRTEGYILKEDGSADSVKRWYWRPEALEMTALDDGTSVFTMFTREWGTRPGESTETTPYYPGQDQSNGKNNAGEKWISGGIHLNNSVAFGYIETRVRTSRTDQNHWDAFWSYNSHSGEGYTMEYEFDCMEAISATNLDVTTHFWDWSPAVNGKFYATKTKKHPSADLNNGWYKLALLWTPEKVVYYAGHDTLEPIAGFQRDGTGLHGYGNLDQQKNEIPLITRWKQQFKYTTELGYNYGSGRPASGTEDKYYIDYFAVYEIPVVQAQMATGLVNGTASFDREQTDNTSSAFADIASEGNKIYVTTVPESGYYTASVTATWGDGQSAVLEAEDQNRYYLTVTNEMPKYFDFATQKYGEKVTITPVFEENGSAPALTNVTVSADPASGIEGETVQITETLTPVNGSVLEVSVPEGITYNRETQQLTLPEIEGENSQEKTITFTYTTKNNATVEADLTVTVYPDTYVRRNGVVYQPMKTVNDFSGEDVSITKPENGNALNVTNQNLVITVNALETKETNSITVNNIPENTGLNPLMELTVNYATSENVSNFRAVASFSQEASHSFWIIRNAYNGMPGHGFAFRAGPNANDANATYSMLANQDVTYGYLFDGSTCQTEDNKAKFFFNGELKTIAMQANTVTKAPVLGTSFTLKFSKEETDTDNGTLTLKKIVFYKPVTE